MLEKILLVKPRGFCAGVNRAILTVEKALEKFGAPIYVRHQIVHNNYVVKDLEDKGAVFVESSAEVPDGGIIIFSAHGVPPEVIEEAKTRNLTPIDATCPLVTKVHLEAVYFQKKGFEIILVGHKGHQEVLGTIGYAKMTLVENVQNVLDLSIPENTEKICFLTQTTLSMDDTEEIIRALKKKYPQIVSAPKEDICYASQNRQNAVKDLIKLVDCVLVVGALNSSNSNRLVETARKRGKDAFLIYDLENIDVNKFLKYKTIGITSGASVPDVLVNRLIDEIRKNTPNIVLEDLLLIKEDIIFPLPKEVN